MPDALKYPPLLVTGLPLIVVESPFAPTHPHRQHESERNLTYARRALLDSVRRGEAPLASHLLYPQVLQDSLPNDRTLGINLGYLWGEHASLVAFYIDLGWSPGMRRAWAYYSGKGKRVERRQIGT